MLKLIVRLKFPVFVWRNWLFITLKATFFSFHCLSKNKIKPFKKKIYLDFMLIFPLHWLCCKIITGIPEQLAKNPVPFFGDQLTRVRLQGAKSLRIMAPTPEGRFADVGPIVCTLWYAKQDFLEVMCCLFVKVFVVLKFLFELMYILLLTRERNGSASQSWQW